jgi:hypothetical protein
MISSAQTCGWNSSAVDAEAAGRHGGAREVKSGVLVASEAQVSHNGKDNFTGVGIGGYR